MFGDILATGSSQGGSKDILGAAKSAFTFVSSRLHEFSCAAKAEQQKHKDKIEVRVEIN